MARFAFAVVLLVACESGERTPMVTAATRAERSSPASSRVITPRAKLDTQALPAPLPERGYAVQSFGIGGAFNAEMVDATTGTLRVVIHGAGSGDRNVDRTLQLDAAQLQQLDQLARDAWAEVQHGKMPNAFDISQELFIVDHDDAFYLRGYPITDAGGYAHTGRPRASDFVLAIENLAGPVFEAP